MPSYLFCLLLMSTWLWKNVSIQAWPLSLPWSDSIWHVTQSVYLPSLAIGMASLGWTSHRPLKMVKQTLFAPLSMNRPSPCSRELTLTSRVRTHPQHLKVAHAASINSNASRQYTRTNSDWCLSFCATSSHWSASWPFAHMGLGRSSSILSLFQPCSMS